MCAVLAFAILTVVILFDLPGFSAAVATIPGAVGVIVAIITESVSDVVHFCASSNAFGLLALDAWVGERLLFVCAIQALAVLAERVIIEFAAAVTAVPVASSVVVPVIASLVTAPLEGLAGFFGLGNTFIAVLRLFVRAIEAFTIFAMCELIRSTVLATAVTTIPIAAGNVVVVVAIAIALVHRFRTLATNPLGAFVLLWLLDFVVAVQTFTLGALCVHALAATVSTVPCTASDVVGVVAESVAFAFGVHAVSLDFVHASVRFVLVTAVAALAIRAVFVIVIWSAAIAAVPVTATVVILVVADCVIDPFRLSAATGALRTTVVLF